MALRLLHNLALHNLALDSVTARFTYRFIILVTLLTLGWASANQVPEGGIPENVSDVPTTEGAARWRLNTQDPVPLMAYYYIWFEPASWSRAKTDYPALGRYSSDDEAVMTQHVRWAKEAGIDGFIVSWKSTYVLDRRLEQLMEVAAREDFHLWIIYQGLDFERDPLPLERIGNDLAFFLERYADHPAFKMYELPVVIWSGTWEYSAQDVERIAAGYQDRLHILASERNLKGFERLADSVAGNAYYWSSVNPDTFPGYEEKLRTLGRAVHERGGLWVAPAAPGFDARLIGGETVVERVGSETLRRQLAAALASSPDAVGLISWNEFSENTHLEPSLRYGETALESLAERQLSAAPQIPDFDSSAPATTGRNDSYPLSVLGGMLIFIVACAAWVAFRRSANVAKS